MEVKFYFNGEVRFVACTQGVIVPTPNTKNDRILYHDWYSKRKWLEDKGLVLGEDFLAPGRYDTPWYFKDIKEQTLFLLKWS